MMHSQLHKLTCRASMGQRLRILNWKLCGKKRSWPILRYFPSIFLDELRKFRKQISQNNQPLGLESYTGANHATSKFSC